MTREQRLKIAKAQAEKAKYQMYGGKERYEEVDGIRKKRNSKSST